MSKTCPKCGGRMDQGYVPEATDHSTKVETWVEGAPEKAWWGGLNMKGKRKLTVQTWRCQRCHYLESYAPGA